MKTLLVLPPSAFERGWANFCLRMDISCLEGFLKMKGRDVVVYDEKYLDVVKLKGMIKRVKPDFLIMSCDFRTADMLVKVARLVKKLNADIRVVLSGPHPTFFHKMILEEFSWVDIVIRGETEGVFTEVLDSFENQERPLDLTKNKGITYRMNGKVVANTDAPVIQDLDSLPFPSRDFFNKHVMNPGHSDEAVTIVAGRGCRYSCRFCREVEIGRRMRREKSAERIVEEIVFCRKNNKARKIVFWENVFTENKQKVKEICQRLKKNNVQVEWICQTRVDCVDKELLKVMKDGGCCSIIYGVESFSDVVLQAMGKGYRAETAMKALNDTNQLGIEAGYDIVLGYPGESKETLEQTVAYLKKMDKKIYCQQVEIFELFPGTIIYEQLRSRGFISDEMWFKDYKVRDFKKKYYSVSFQKILFWYRKYIRENFYK